MKRQSKRGLRKRAMVLQEPLETFLRDCKTAGEVVCDGRPEGPQPVHDQLFEALAQDTILGIAEAFELAEIYITKLEDRREIHRLAGDVMIEVRSTLQAQVDHYRRDRDLGWALYFAKTSPEKLLDHPHLIDVLAEYDARPDSLPEHVELYREVYRTRATIARGGETVEVAHLEDLLQGLLERRDQLLAEEQRLKRHGLHAVK